MKNSEIITKLALDPILFVETMLGAKPQKWQRKVLEDLLIHCDDPLCQDAITNISQGLPVNLQSL